MLVHENHKAEGAMCSFCGERSATALWMGQIEIFSCSVCASETLPQLMADAIVGGLNLKVVQSSLDPITSLTKERRILERFHGAFNGALLRKMRTQSES